MTTGSKKVETDPRKFQNDTKAFNHHGEFTIELTDDASREVSAAAKHQVRFEGNTAHITGTISNPAWANLGQRLTFQAGDDMGWPWAQVKLVRFGDGRLMWVNNTHYPPVEKPAGKTRCQQAIEVLDGIVDEYFAIEPYRRNAEQLHYKDQFYGALKLLRCLPIHKDEWESLRQCVIRNERRLYLDSKKIGETLAWITETEK